MTEEAVLKALQKQHQPKFAEVTLEGWRDGEAIPLKKLVIHAEYEGYLWFEFVTSKGIRLQSGLFKEAPVL